MKKALVLLFAVLVAAVLFAGCSGSNTPATSPTTTSPGDSPSAPASDAAAIPDFTLTVKAPDGDKQFTSSDAAKLTPVTLEATTTNKNGDSTTSTYVGVKLSDILNAVGVSDFTSLTIVASDGFSADYSNDLAMADDTILAWVKDGATFTTDPPVQMTPKQGTGNQFVKQVSEIDVTP